MSCQPERQYTMSPMISRTKRVSGQAARTLAVFHGQWRTIGQLSFRKLSESKVPLIVGIVANGYNHFVIFRGFDGEWVYLADPSRGNIRVPSWQFVCEWQKNTVLVVAKKGERPRTWSPLHVTGREMAVEEPSWQYIRTFPSRVIPHPSAP